MRMGKGFVSMIIASLAILAVLLVISVQQSNSGSQSAALAALSAKRVAERNADARAMLNNSEIDALMDSAYAHCGCAGASVSGLSADIQSKTLAYFTSAATKLTDGVVSTSASGASVNAGNDPNNCNPAIDVAYSYSIVTSSVANPSTGLPTAKLSTPVSLTRRLQMSHTGPPANPASVEFTVSEASSSKVVADVKVTC